MLKSFSNAFRGLLLLLKNERNFKIHLIAFVGVCSLGFYLDISKSEWIAVLLCSALVLSLEGLNSSIEKLCDLYSVTKDERIRNIKDIAAGAVLVAAIVAAVVAGLVFLPYLF
jgi:diacylglycerol kinase